MISIKDGKTKNRKIENMLLNALHTKIRHTSWYALFYEPAAIYARSICSLSGRIFCESSLSRLLPSPAGSPLNGDSLFPGTPVG